MRTLSVFLFGIVAFLAPVAQAQDADMSSDPIAATTPYSVTLSVSDIERAAAWYRDNLDFEEVQRKSYPEFSTDLVFLERGGFRVELIRDGNATSGEQRPDPPAHTSTFGVSQFAFETADLAAVRAALEERGVEITWAYENEDLGARFLFVRDPDGNLIQFLERL